MAAKKPPEDELMAICRLEFYKKQQNWKFCSQERKAKESKKKAKACNTKLNETYNIERGPKQEPAPESPLESPLIEEEPQWNLETEDCADLNKAFVDTETDIDEPAQPQDPGDLIVAQEAEKDNKPSTSLDLNHRGYSPRWSIQDWAERCGFWNLEQNGPSASVCPSVPVCPQPTPTPTNTQTDHSTHTKEVYYSNQNLNFPQKETSPTPTPTNTQTDHTTHTQEVYYSNQNLKFPQKETSYPHDINPKTNGENFQIHYTNQEVFYSCQNPSYPYKSSYDNSKCPSQFYDTRIQESFNPKCVASVLYYNSSMRPSTVLTGGNILSVEKLRGWQGEEWERCAGEGAAWVETDCLQAVEEPEGAWGAGEVGGMGTRSAGEVGGEGTRGAVEVGGVGTCGAEEVGGVGTRGAGGEDAVDCGGEVLAEDWLQRDLSEVSPCDSMASVASGEFFRGAALVPHSTQIDILVDEAGVSGALSHAALAAAVARHSAVLQRLLCEAWRREQLDQPPVPDPPYISPSELCYPAPVFNDPIVAGSYKNTPDRQGHTEAGRGRGRLKVIGMNMGRPYRLSTCE